MAAVRRVWCWGFYWLGAGLEATLLEKDSDCATSVVTSRLTKVQGPILGLIRAAVRDQIAVNYLSAADATAHRDDFLKLGAGLSVYDNHEWRSVGANGINRFFESFTITGYVVMAAAGLGVVNVFVLGLVQRKRERAVLRAIGATAGIASVFRHEGQLGVSALPLETGVACVIGLVLAAAIYPVLHSRRLETVEVLRTS